MAIDRFWRDYWFLSNFSRHEIRLGGITWPTAEHAFQAAKATNWAAKAQIAAARTPQAAKRIGNSIPCRADWEKVKVEAMRQVIKAKFNQHPDIASRLLDTGDEELIEGNWWGDQYWGVSRGAGQNMLGKLLMELRDELREKLSSETARSS